MEHCIQKTEDVGNLSQEICESLKKFGLLRKARIINTQIQKKVYSYTYLTAFGEFPSNQTSIMLAYQQTEKAMTFIFGTSLQSIDFHELCREINEANINAKNQESIFYYNTKEKLLQGKLSISSHLFQDPFLMNRDTIFNIIQKHQQQFKQLLLKTRRKQKTAAQASHQSKEKETSQRNQLLKKKILSWILIWRDKIIEQTKINGGYAKREEEVKREIKNVEINCQVIEMMEKNKMGEKQKKETEIEKILKACGEKKDYKSIFKNNDSQKGSEEATGKEEKEKIGTIVKTISIINQRIDQDWKPGQSNSYGSLRRMIADYLVTSISLYYGTNQLLDTSKSTKCSGYIINKSPKKDYWNMRMGEDSVESFKNEVWALKFIRLQTCQSIAEYYFLEISKELEEVSNFYVKWYNQTLQSLILNNCDPKYLFYIMKNVIMGIQFLNSTQLCHRDLKPSNIMIDEDFLPKFIDFGSCSPFLRLKSSLNQNYCFTQKCRSTRGYFASPQQILDPKIQLHLINTAQGLTKTYEEMTPRQRIKSLEEVVLRHPNFDIYSLGTILLQCFIGEGRQKSHSAFIAQKITWIAKMCQAINPASRPDVSLILIYWKLLSKYWKILNE